MNYIEFNGKRSDYFGLILQRERLTTSTYNDVETVEVQGRDGVLLKDNHRLVPVERGYPFSLVSTDNSTAITNISNWLNVKGWHDLILSWEPDYIYKATVINQIETEEVLRQFGKIKITFLIHPIKYLKNGRQEITLKNGMTLRNEGNVQAKPVFKITGSGSGIITINGYETSLENVQENIVIDSEKHIVYKGRLSAWNTIVRTAKHRMPLFDVGDNQISWTGNFTIKATPNWGVKV